MALLFLDTETYNETSIKVGTYKYAASCELLILTYALDDGPVKLWEVASGEPCPLELQAAFADPEVTLVAHNAMFDRIVLRHTIGLSAPITRWHCTMVQALAHSLPGSLADLGTVFKLSADKAKLADGKKLVRKFCAPLRKKRSTKVTHPEEWARFCLYAKQDVEAMRECYRRMPTVNFRGFELGLWRLDQLINDRGVQVDLDLAHAATKALAADRVKQNAAMAVRTGGRVQSANQRDALIDYILEEHGVELPDAKKTTIELLLKDDSIEDDLKELLAARVGGSGSTGAKYQALLKAEINSRLYGALQFCGADRTGRWAGRVFQPQNLMRPTMKAADIALGIEALKGGYADLLYDIPELAGNAVRGCIVAAPGKKLVTSDLASIESRMLAWLAGEKWKLDAYRELDLWRQLGRPGGYDMYVRTYAQVFSADLGTVTAPQRSIGKGMELSFGYAGGVGAFQRIAINGRVNLEALAKLAWPTLPPELVREAEDFYDWQAEQGSLPKGMSRKVFVTCDTLKRAWRRANPATGRLWKALDTGAKSVIQTGEPTQVGSIRLAMDGAHLTIQLPSGRLLYYINADVVKKNITYWGKIPNTTRYGRITTHGGSICGHITQATARDVLAASLPRIERAGYAVVLTVHDEVVAEVPDSPEFTEKGLGRLMTLGESWTRGLPLASEGYEAYRYRK